MEIQEAHLNEIFESSEEAAALVAADGRLLRANPAFFHLFGFGSRQVPELRLDEVLPSGLAGADPMAALARAEAGQSTSFDAVGRKADGAALEVSVSVGPARLPGRPAAALVLFRDDARKALVETAFRRLGRALDAMQLGVTVSDMEGRIVYVNPAEASMHGWAPEDLVGRDVQVLGPEDLASQLSPGELEAMGTWKRESVNVRRDGTTFPVQLMSDVIRNSDGRLLGVVTTCEDITQRKLTEAALRASEERYALALRGAADGLWDWTLATDEVFYSARWCETLGLGEHPVDARLSTWLDRVHPEDLERLRGELEDLREGRATRLESEHRVRHEDGAWLWVLVRGVAEPDPGGDPYRVTGSVTNITDRKGQERRLARDALYDPLTGLPNRAFLRDLLERSMARLARRGDYVFAVLFLDLDRFKQVNDTLGHAAGDELLRQVAEVLRTSVRPGDVVTRLSGDEFCVVLDEVAETADATRVARRVLDRLDRPLDVGGRPVLTGCSIGIAFSDPRMEDSSQILAHADAAMYRAKSRGRSRFELFDRAMQEQAVRMLRLEEDLREGLASGQLRLLYQPIVRLEDRRVTGLEALVRWHHPTRGVLNPAAFMERAEESGMSVPLGWWTLEEACGQMARWSDRFPGSADLWVSVNLSAQQLRHPDLADRVRQALDRSGLEARRLRLDVSEVTLMESPEWHETILGSITGMGVLVQVDDFGTGSSSLSYLNRFPVSTLKIDRSFIRDVARPSDRAAVVEVFIELARRLGIPVVAEGIENDAHEARLQSFRCEHGQGYLYHQPLDPDAVSDLLAATAGDAA